MHQLSTVETLSLYELLKLILLLTLDKHLVVSQIFDHAHLQQSGVKREVWAIYQ